MKISAKAEYACIAMLDLASSHAGPQPVRIKTIAEAHGIPQRFLVQILLQLKTAGLVASVRGAGGGYQLALAPEQISLADVINAIDREAWRVARGEGTAGRRDSAAARTLKTVWRQINAEEQRLLKQLTLAELVRRIQQGATLSYQI
jgi:Rrf2 family cysteine metabolism transcriptional repressor